MVFSKFSTTTKKKTKKIWRADSLIIQSVTQELHAEYDMWEKNIFV